MSHNANKCILANKYFSAISKEKKNKKREDASLSIYMMACLKSLSIYIILYKYI